MQGRAAMEEAGAARRRASARAAAMEGVQKELAWREAGSRVGSGDAPARAQVGTRRAHQHAMQRARRPGVSVSLLMRAPQKQKAALQVGGGLAMQTARRAASTRSGCLPPRLVGRRSTRSSTMPRRRCLRGAVSDRPPRRARWPSSSPCPLPRTARCLTAPTSPNGGTAMGSTSPSSSRARAARARANRTAPAPPSTRCGGVTGAICSAAAARRGGDGARRRITLRRVSRGRRGRVRARAASPAPGGRDVLPRGPELRRRTRQARHWLPGRRDSRVARARVF